MNNFPSVLWRTEKVTQVPAGRGTVTVMAALPIDARYGKQGMFIDGRVDTGLCDWLISNMRQRRYRRPIIACGQSIATAHKAKIAELKEQPKYQTFHAELTGDRLAKLSTLHGHFGANVYLAGPQVIPDDILDRSPEDEFFFTVDPVDETQH